MGAFTGQLNSNEIFAALYNMIISQEVFADNIKTNDNNALVDMARVDGGLYGDTKLYYATDVLKSTPWGNDAEATNLLALHRPPSPECQGITLDIFRQISLTVDNYLSKRAWGTEGAFGSFNSVMLGWINETKKVYDGTTYNAFIGTDESTDQTVHTYEIVTNAGNNSVGENVANGIANLIDDMEDYSRAFNDYGFLRSYNATDLLFVWNNKFRNKVRKIDLPSIFHNEELAKMFDGYKLNSRFFGTVQTSAVTAGNNDGTYRSLVEADYTVDDEVVHIFAGDLIPAGVAIAANVSYKEDNTIICKVFVKLPPYMSAFQVGTSFFNPKSLTENHYLTFGHNTLEHLKNYPVITVRATESND